MKRKFFQWKKAASTMLAAAMIMGVAGCGQETQQTASTDAGSTPAAENEEVSAPADDAGEGAPEHVELTVWFMNEGSNYQKVFDRFEELTKDTLNTSINLNWTTNHGQEMPLKLMNQEPCDLTFDAYWVNLGKHIQDGLYADLTAYFNNPEYPGLQKAFSGDLLESMYSADGKIYAIPLLEFYNDARCIWIRGDWRKQYDLPEVTDAETFKLYLDTMMEHKDELGIETPAGIGNRGYFYFNYDAYTKVANGICEVDGTGARATQQFEALISADGKTVLDANMIGDPDERFADYPEGFQSNYRNAQILALAEYGQYVNEDFATATDLAARFNNGKFAIGEGNLSGYVSTLQNLQSVDPDAELECYFYETQVQNMEKTYSNQAYANNYMVVPYYSENIDRTMKFLDWIFASQENNDLFHYGIEGEDYVLNDDGTITSLTPANKYSFPGYQLCWSPIYYHTDSALGDYVKYDQWARNQENFSPNPILGFTFNPNESTEVSTSVAAFKALQENYYHHFMAGAFLGDTQAMIDEFYELASPDIEIIREAIMRQLQTFLDEKNK